MRRSTRVALAVCWPVYAVVVVLAWRKVSAAPGGDVNGLFVATVCSFAGLLLLSLWLQDQGSGGATVLTCKLCYGVLLRCPKCLTVGCSNPECLSQRFAAARCLVCHGLGEQVWSKGKARGPA